MVKWYTGFNTVCIGNNTGFTYHAGDNNPNLMYLFVYLYLSHYMYECTAIQVPEVENSSAVYQ